LRSAGVWMVSTALGNPESIEALNSSIKIQTYLKNVAEKATQAIITSDKQVSS